MSEISSKIEVYGNREATADGFKEIKPENAMSAKGVRDYWDSIFDKKTDVSEDDNTEKDLEKTIKEYFDDLKDKSECPETISDKPFEASDLEKRSPDENAEMREKFTERKDELKKEWEVANGKLWPKYKRDVYSTNGKLIRKAGMDYDIHHIQPLGMGGKNEASNIAPLHADVHYDKQGVHSSDSPYSKLDKILGGID